MYVRRFHYQTDLNTLESTLTSRHLTYRNVVSVGTLSQTKWSL